jgi:hypothetical protein
MAAVGGPLCCGVKLFSIFIVVSSSFFPSILSFRLLNLITALSRCIYIQWPACCNPRYAVIEKLSCFPVEPKLGFLPFVFNLR